jgi:putative SOS response-associated peptidase YedK
MCGRYGRRADKQRIAEWFHTHNTTVFDESTYAPTYFAPSFNVAPQSFQPIVLLSPESGERELTVMRWGLVPFWSKDAKSAFSTINAKAETIATSPAYREAWKRRRCLVPAEWFYEWQKTGERTKQPFAIGMKEGGMFAFAGLWETWTDKVTGQTLETYTIITTDPNELTEKIHNRMPVIVRPQDYVRWMAPTDPAHLPSDLLKPYPAEEMTAWKVGDAVGNVRNNRPELVEPLEVKNQEIKTTQGTD